METVQTLIEFVNTGSSPQTVATTGDILFSSLALLMCIFALAVIFFIFSKNSSRFDEKQNLFGNVKALVKNPAAIVITGFVLIISFLSVMALFSTAFGDNSEKAQASDKVFASVNEETGEVVIDKGYLINVGTENLYVIEVNVEYLDGIIIDDQCSWQVSIDNQVAYKDVPGVPSKELGIKVGNSETEFTVSNLSAETAKALIGKTVAKVTFSLDNFNAEQVKAFEALDKSVGEAATSISQIPENQLLDEDRKTINDKITKIKEEYEVKIAETTDADELQALLKAMQDDIDKLLKEAQDVASETLQVKQEYIKEAQQTLANFKEQLTANDWLSEEKKDAFSARIITLESEINKVNQASSWKDVNTILENISSEFDQFQTDLDNQTAQAKAAQIAEAKAFVDGSYSTALQTIENIDNLTSGTKTYYQSGITTFKNEAYGNLDQVTSPTEIETIKEQFVADASNLITEATAKAHRPWVLNTWEPETEFETSAKSSFTIEAIAEVSSEDPFKSEAPYPTYLIDSNSNDADYFCVETTEDHKAKITVAEDTPDGSYNLNVYAQFGNVPDKGYKTKSNKVTLAITVSPASDEILLQTVDKPIGWDAAGQISLLSDGGIELIENDAKPGDVLNLCFIPLSDAWTAQIWEGHWGGKYDEIKKENYDLEGNDGKYKIILTEELLQTFTTQQGWGGVLLVQGQEMKIEKVTLTKATEVTLAEGEWIADDWGNQPTLLSDGATEILEEGGEVGYFVNFYFSSTEAFYNLQIVEGHWGGTFADLNNGSYDPVAAGGGYSLELTEDIFNQITTKQNWGGTFILNGDNVVCTKLTLSRTKKFN